MEVPYGSPCKKRPNLVSGNKGQKDWWPCGTRVYG